MSLKEKKIIHRDLKPANILVDAWKFTEDNPNYLLNKANLRPNKDISNYFRKIKPE
jgi:serine/threonine protein kinase